MKKYHYFYKITNNINNKYYYGIHSTSNLDDGYMGSGKRLHYAYKKYGIENFTKEILEYFETREAAAEYESKIVNYDLIHDNNCYNIICGGEARTTVGTATVKDGDGNILQVPIDDPRYLSGELVGHTKGKVNVKDENNNSMQVPIDDPRYLSGELVGCTKNFFVAKETHGKTTSLKTDKTLLKVYQNIMVISRI